MKRNLYALPKYPPGEPPAPPLRRERLIYLPEQATGRRRRKTPLITWEHDPSLPRWLDALSIWVEIASTLFVTVWSGYWMWYAMWILR